MTCKNLKLIEQIKSSERQLPVTRPYFPPIENYTKLVERVYENGWLTNGGPVLGELTERLKQKFQTEHLLIVNNGTSALQVAYKIFNLENKNVITSPYTFPATATALQWVGANVVHADICPKTWNLDPKSVREVLAKQKIDAIVPVNIFGNPCDLAEFDRIGKEYNIPIIYDSAQALLSKYDNQSIFNFGDVHCVSFHATKLFHTVEGGALIFKNKAHYQTAQKLINFGIESSGEVLIPGTNAKLSELHAAMGMCVLDDLNKLVLSRERSIALYKKNLHSLIKFQSFNENDYVPPMYMPILFPSERTLLDAEKLLHTHNVLSRRYFYPRNHKFLTDQQTSKHNLSQCDLISNRILCIPLMHEMKTTEIIEVCQLIDKVFVE
ncbi:DegT/DnrJ/EryC1/StrS family aminotransferase [Psychrosphaera sp.]|nr:DegT/DnrJ/EryC1/StrS family aminotransferase [Psychrosphaera sp.]